MAIAEPGTAILRQTRDDPDVEQHERVTAMTLLRNAIFAALAAVTLAPAAPSEAMPLAPAATTRTHSDVTAIAWRRICRNGRCRRVWVGRPVVVVPRVVIRPRYVRPRVVVRQGVSAHVRWCLARYRSYDPATDTFVGYDGRARACISPYLR
jgi:hypothetical protein